MPTCPLPLPCFLPGPRYAYTAQVCAERACVLSMNRPADKGNDYMAVFILNVIFIDESYQLGRPVRSRSAEGWCAALLCFLFLCCNESLSDSSTQSVSSSGGMLCLSEHTCLLIRSNHFTGPPLIYIFRRIFHRKRVLSSIFAGEIESFASERAGLSRTRNLLWKPGSSRRNPGNVLTQK